MARESTVARESKANPINAVSYSPRTVANRTLTGYVNDAILRRSSRLMSQYANFEPFSSKTGVRNEQELRNSMRISRATRNMLARNRGLYFE